VIVELISGERRAEIAYRREREGGTGKPVCVESCGELCSQLAQSGDYLCDSTTLLSGSPALFWLFALSFETHFKARASVPHVNRKKAPPIGKSLRLAIDQPAFSHSPLWIRFQIAKRDKFPGKWAKIDKLNQAPM